MGRYRSRFDAYIALLLDHPYGYSCQEAATILGVSRQTVAKYNALARSRLGYDLVQRQDGRYCIPDGHRRDVQCTFTLTTQEVHDLLAAARSLDQATDSVRSALAKIAASRGNVTQRDFAMEPAVYYESAVPVPPGVYDQVVQAILNRRTATLTYQPARGAAKTYEFDPYVVLARDGRLYLVGANHNSRRAGHDPIKRLRLDQVQAVRLSTTSFPTPHFDIQAYVAANFGVFATAGPPQQVAGYGGHARVLAPPELRDQVLRHAREILHTYEQDGIKGVDSPVVV